jgi:hypothetical protein
VLELVLAVLMEFLISITKSSGLYPSYVNVYVRASCEVIKTSQIRQICLVNHPGVNNRCKYRNNNIKKFRPKHGSCAKSVR